jgi:hypothetical protein
MLGEVSFWTLAIQFIGAALMKLCGETMLWVSAGLWFGGVGGKLL